MEDFVLNEAYYGKNKTLLEIEGLFAKISDDFKNNKNPNSNKEVIEAIQNKLAYLFGFEKVIFSVFMNDTVLNAFTTPIFYNGNHTATDKFYDLVRSKEGGIKFKDPKGKTLYVYMFSYMFRNCTPDNIMAVLLHEIGHNFFLVKEQAHNSKNKAAVDIIYNILAVMKYYDYDPKIVVKCINMMISVAYDLSKGINVAGYEEYKQFLTDKAMLKAQKQEASKKTVLHKGMLLLKNIFGSLFGVLLSPLKLLLIPLKMSYLATAKLELRETSRKDEGYAAETFSDSFAVAYGYGYETAKLFAKTFMENSTIDEQFLSKIPIIRLRRYYNEMDNIFFNYYTDPHPTSKKRLENTLAKLKYELANNKDLKKEQIEDIKKQIKQVEDLMSSAPTYVKIVNKIFDSKDNERDKIGTSYVSNDQIFDAESTEEILGKNMKKESFEFNDNLNLETLNEDAYNDLRYNKKAFKEKYINPENQDIFDLIYKKR